MMFLLLCNFDVHWQVLKTSCVIWFSGILTCDPTHLRFGCKQKETDRKSRSKTIRKQIPRLSLTARSHSRPKQSWGWSPNPRGSMLISTFLRDQSVTINHLAKNKQTASLSREWMGERWMLAGLGRRMGGAQPNSPSARARPSGEVESDTHLSAGQKILQSRDSVSNH